MRKRTWLVALLLIVFLAGTQSLFVQAHEIPDMGKKGSISITMLDGDTRVSGGEVEIYRVAQIQDNDGYFVFSLTDEYINSNVSLKDTQSKSAAKALADYIAQNALTGMHGVIDEMGEIAFHNLDLGLYLVVQTKAATGYYLVDPFLVSVPMYTEAEGYLYDVIATPKVALVKLPEESTEPPTEPSTEPTEPSEPDSPTEPTEPPEPTTPPEPDEPKLPQTGQTNWPIPILAVSGLSLFILGWFLCSAKQKRTDAK